MRASMMSGITPDEDYDDDDLYGESLDTANVYKCIIRGFFHSDTVRG